MIMFSVCWKGEGSPICFHNCASSILFIRAERTDGVLNNGKGGMLCVHKMFNCGGRKASLLIGLKLEEVEGSQCPRLDQMHSTFSGEALQEKANGSQNEGVAKLR